MSGWSVSSAGDVNGDGLSDLVIGAYTASPSTRTDAGKSYVLFGNQKIGKGNVLLGGVGIFNLSILKTFSIFFGMRGFILNGEAANDNCGYSVSSAGDVNGDGFDDLVIGAYNADPSGRLSAGKSYVVYGSSNLGSAITIELSSLNGSNGFILNGEITLDRSSFSVSSAGDVNGDGFVDLIIGAPNASLSGKRSVGKSYVVFGSRTLGSGGVLELSSLNGTNGFTLIGDADEEMSGSSVSSAGDVNGDGIVDLVIGACFTEKSRTEVPGKVYVVFGSQNIGSSGTLTLSTLNGSSGFILNGEPMNFGGCFSVSSAGDVNGDGIDDLVMGDSYISKSYVVFGRKLVKSTLPVLPTIRQTTPLLSSTPYMTANVGPSTIRGQTAIKVNGDVITSNTNTMRSPVVLIGQTAINPIEISSVQDSMQINPANSEGKSFSSTRPPTSFLKRVTLTNLPAKSSSISSTNQVPIIVGIAVGVTAFACSLLSVGFFFLGKRYTRNKISNDAAKKATPSTLVTMDIGTLQTEMQSARMDNTYGELQLSETQSHYQDLPQHPPKNTGEHYKKYSLDQLNREWDQYQAEKALSTS